MNKSIYVITGVIALSISGAAMSQDRGQSRGMSAMDTDGNGTVEKSEFSAMFDKRFAETDTNGGGITLEEYLAKQAADRAARDERREAQRDEREERRAEQSEERAARDAERTKKRFDSMDADGNGSISADEYNAVGERMFDRMDRDSDGILNDRRGRGERSRRGRGEPTN
ncbi:MAG: hypothetical protein HOJ34_11510 [Kordiimonadaceae bacterium]|jgi:hypothetical protein|nr:hypothetical protein [Kordiimonadaceae bacterium]MBT6035827.1 hypothetical protein [Kordiimonadaceae bacterium]MBT6330399.1 hypothetical protein [Kordiimonadaceae bacterium]MBT7583838.1 hypothetical protein [Kordiimonadaceae bacterium]